MLDTSATQSPNHPITQSLVLSIIGGTGVQGTALARRFAKAGVAVILGSRDAKRGADAAAEMNASLRVDNVTGTSNLEAAQQGDIVLLSVPYAGMEPILKDIDAGIDNNKIIINIASSLDPEKKTRAKVPASGSITAEIQNFFGPRARVVAAFQNISPEKLNSQEQVDSDVLVCGGDKDAREKVIAMIHQAGMDAFDVGVLANAVVVETLTAVLIAVNVKYKVKGAGIRLTSVPRNG